MSEQLFDARLRKLIAALGFRSGNEFSKACGFASAEKVNRLLRDPQNQPSMDFLQVIAHKFAVVNMRWLITGEGSMIEKAPNQSNKYTLLEVEKAPKKAPKKAPNAENDEDVDETHTLNVLNENSNPIQIPFRS